MNNVPTKALQLAELEELHQQAVMNDSPWQLVWQMFHDNPWFGGRLDSSARRLIRQYDLPLHFKDDLKQEALLLFARSIQRDISLNYDDRLGSYGSFLTTIVYRCCQKGLRQFDSSKFLPIDGEFSDPEFVSTSDVDEHIDLHDALGRLQEPYRSTIRMVCQGRSVDWIAKKTLRSERTIYRWLEKATQLLRDAWELEIEHEPVSGPQSRHPK